MKRRQRSEKARLYQIKFQADLWPDVAKAQGWNIQDEVRRRDLRKRCWDDIGLRHKADAMPVSDAEFTALKTLCLHLADEDNITKSIAWDNCRADFRAYNDARVADHHQRRAGVHEYRNRPTAAGQPLDTPLGRKATSHRGCMTKKWV